MKEGRKHEDETGRVSGVVDSCFEVSAAFSSDPALLGYFGLVLWRVSRPFGWLLCNFEIPLGDDT